MNIQEILVPSFILNFSLSTHSYFGEEEIPKNPFKETPPLEEPPITPVKEPPIIPPDDAQPPIYKLPSDSPVNVRNLKFLFDLLNLKNKALLLILQDRRNAARR